MVGPFEAWLTDCVCRKGAKKSWNPEHVRSYMTKEAVLLVYNTIILALFDDCNIWRSLLQQDIDRLQQIQIELLG